MAQFIETAQPISSAASARDLAGVLHRLNTLVGLKASVFTSFMREDEEFESYRYVVACPPEWCNQYSAKRWFAIDPCLIYAQTSAEPVLVEHVPVKTAGQRELMAAAQEFGFVSGAIFPVHSPAGRSRMGVLYIAAEQPGFFNAADLSAMKCLFRSVAADMLDWWTNKIRAELLKEVRLSTTELTLLRMEWQGLRTKEIAIRTGLSGEAIDARFRRIAQRFGEPSRSNAARRAAALGLLEE